MPNATCARDGADPTTGADPVPYVLTERAEARMMLDELFRLLRRGGRLNLSDLERRMADNGTPVCRRQLVRWANGQSAPRTTTPVEHLARVAGVNRAYLIPTREAVR